VLGRLRAPGPAGCVAECAALQLTARSVGPTTRISVLQSGAE